ncbi:MAG: hypothetical protein NZ805_11405 [Armatimonadetes bacterium]|nr:hypothetical protein [Armatimonadota bacterium]MDW8028454.1 hypothetical protein [Armatimonadota bacterium]
MVQPLKLKERIDSPALAAEFLFAELKARFPQIQFKVIPQLFVDEDISVEIRAPKEICNQVEKLATELCLQIELETGFFVLPFVYPQESEKC